MTVSPSLPAITPRGLPRLLAAFYVGLPPALFDDMVRSGGMPAPKRIADVQVWDRIELDAAFDRLSEAGTGKPPPYRPDFTPTVYSVKTLAERSGCSQRHVRTMIKRGDIPSITPGGLLRIRIEDIDIFERSGGVG